MRDFLDQKGKVISWKDFVSKFHVRYKTLRFRIQNTLFSTDFLTPTINPVSGYQWEKPMFTGYNLLPYITVSKACLTQRPK